MDGKTDMNAVEESKQKLYDNFIEVYKAAGNSFENPTDEKKKDAIFCNDTIDGVFKRSIWSMINALNKPSDEKNYADAAAQFAYRAYGFSGDQYNYIVSSIDKQFMEIIKMEMMYQEFIAQRGDYFEEKYPDDESKWESYAAWTNDLNKLNEDVAKAMDTMLDREILVSDSTVGSIRMKLDEFVKPEDMVSVRMKNENYHEKLTGEFYENEQPIIDAFNEGYLCLTHNTHSDCVLNYEIMNNNDESIQNGTWYANGFLFNLFTGAGQEATDKLRLNRNQLYNKDLSVWGGQYTGTLNFYTKIVDVHAQ